MFRGYKRPDEAFAVTMMTMTVAEAASMGTIAVVEAASKAVAVTAEATSMVATAIEAGCTNKSVVCPKRGVG